MDVKLDKKSPASSAQKPNQGSVSYTKTSNQGPIGNIADRMKGVFSNRTTAILAVLVLVLGVGAGIIAVQRSTEIRQRASTPTAPVPGTCLVLEEQYCKTGKPVYVNGQFFGVGFKLPLGTTIYAADKGNKVPRNVTIDKNTYPVISVVKSSDNGSYVTVFYDQLPKPQSLRKTSNSISENVNKGDKIGSLSNVILSSYGDYNLVVYFSSQSQPFVSAIDKKSTLDIFGL